jgi:hypothetical protein
MCIFLASLPFQAEYDLVSKNFSSDRNSYDKDAPQRTFAKTKLQLSEFKKEIIKIIEEFKKQITDTAIVK